MKLSWIIVASLGLLGITSSPEAFAAKADGNKAKLIAKYDKNGNGVIDGDEMEPLRKAYATEPNGVLKEYDANNDNKLSDEEIAAIKSGAGSKKRATVTAILAKYDENGNGVIDANEMATLRKDFAANPTTDLKQLDSNNDGKLSDTEIAAIKPKQSKKERLGALIAKYDKNGDGTIDATEAEELRKDYAAKPAGDLKQFDTNKDGKLSEEETASIKAPEPKKGKGEKVKVRAARPDEKVAPEPSNTTPK